MLGSQNSSNSRRLAEIAESMGIPAHLVDGVSEIQKNWFERVESVLITAGASAPEDVVQECIDYLVGNHGATIEEAFVREENVHFPLPKSLRELLPAGTVLPVGADVEVDTTAVLAQTASGPMATTDRGGLIVLPFRA